MAVIYRLDANRRYFMGPKLSPNAVWAVRREIMFSLIELNSLFCKSSLD